MGWRLFAFWGLAPMYGFGSILEATGGEK